MKDHNLYLGGFLNMLLVVFRWLILFPWRHWILTFWACLALCGCVTAFVSPAAAIPCYLLLSVFMIIRLSVFEAER